MWTHFWDMHSGGGNKEGSYENIFIELPEAAAKDFFINRFGHDPDDTYCECCGPNYSVDESETLEEATSYHRDTTRYSEEKKEPLTVAEYGNRPDVLYITVEDVNKFWTSITKD